MRGLYVWRRCHVNGNLVPRKAKPIWGFRVEGFRVFKTGMVSAALKSDILLDCSEAL